MSLDVYLAIDQAIPVKSDNGIYVRRDGRTVRISRDEWDTCYPGIIPATVSSDETETNEVYTSNITHNLGAMAREAGIYEHLWRPDELGITRARQLIEPLSIGLSLMRREPERFRKLNPTNGWGDYDGFVDWIASYLEACWRVAKCKC